MDHILVALSTFAGFDDRPLKLLRESGISYTIHPNDSGHLTGAGLDVFEKEPHSGPLCELENVILTPHSATIPVETHVAMETEAIDKAIRFVRNQLLPNEKVI